MFGRYKDYAILPLRLVLGLILLVHGYGKLFDNAPGMEKFIGFVGTVVPATIAPLLGWIVALVEFVGGILIILGLWTRIAALFVSIEFVVILLFFLRSKIGFGAGTAELEELILVVALFLLLAGAGSKFNLEKAWFKTDLLSR